MKGAIAAGTASTADAGAAILRDGGNAVDAAVGACFAVTAGEPAIASLAGGGIMLYRNGNSGEMVLCDFFANAPGLGGRPPDPMDFHAVELDFGPARQVFHIGAGAAAVPGVIPGLCTALERWGSMPLSQVIQPACAALRQGVIVGEFQASTIKLLKQILLRTPQGRKLFAPQGQLIGARDRFKLPQLADTLEEMAAAGWREFYDGELAQRMLCRFGPERGGLLTTEDLATYEVVFRKPLETGYRSSRIYSNPPPAAGGAMIALMLRLLEREDPGLLAGRSRRQAHALCRAMRIADEARAAGPDELLPERAAHWAELYESRAGQPLSGGPRLPGGGSSTTHVSVIDAAGNAASISFSFGEGNGEVIEETGIMMNNLMGEEDLFPDGFHRWPVGQRLATMMSPTLMVSLSGDVTVVGTGGSSRIRTALVQVISRLLDAGSSVAETVQAGRLHFEAGVLNAETFDRDGDEAMLRGLGAATLVTFEQPSLFFGGVNLVHLLTDGTMDGVGDPRRSGACRIV